VSGIQTSSDEPQEKQQRRKKRKLVRYTSIVSLNSLCGWLLILLNSYGCFHSQGPMDCINFTVICGSRCISCKCFKAVTLHEHTMQLCSVCELSVLLF